MQPTQKQTTLDMMTPNKRKWTPDEAPWKANARRLVEFVARDMQPLRIVEKAGFRQFVEGLQPRFELPGRKWLTDTGLPKLCNDVKERIRRCLDDAEWVSFTSDIWTADHTNVSFISLTAHWISRQFERKMAVLHVTEFSESHSAVSIATYLNIMLDEWGLLGKVS